MKRLLQDLEHIFKKVIKIFPDFYSQLLSLRIFDFKYLIKIIRVGFYQLKWRRMNKLLFIF